MRKWSLLLLLMLGACKEVTNYPDKENVLQADLRVIDGTLAKAPTLGSDQDDAWAFLELKEYPGVTFVTRGVRYKAFDAKLFSIEIHPGDTVRIGMHKDNTRITKGEAPAEKMITIEPYSVEARGKSYMSLSRVNEVFEEDRSSKKFQLWWFIGIAVAGGLIYLGLRITGVIKKTEGDAGASEIG